MIKKYLIPELLPGYEVIQAKYAGTRRPFSEPPKYIIIHSGDKSEGVAEYFANKWTQRKVWTHFAWSKKHDCLVQCDSLLNTTSHAGKPWNDISIGIELPGPWHQLPRSGRQKQNLRWLIRDLKSYIPWLETVTAHQFLKASKKDPGPGVDEGWFVDLGLKVLWIKQY